MEPVRVAIVGMGIGRDNGRGFAADPRARVVALCDIVEEKMKDFAKELGGDLRLFPDYKVMCRDKNIDAVFVGTPNQLHVPVALEAVRNGKHVLVTKPLADSVASARELVETAEKAGVVNMMSLSTRFCDEARQVAFLRDRGELGRVYFSRATSVRRSGIPDWNPGFVQKGGGAFRDMGVHALDAAWYLMGMPRPTRVLGVAGANFGPRGQGFWDFRQPPESYWRQYDTDDYGCGFIRFQDGSGMQIESHWASHQPELFNVELFGTEGGARLFPATLYRTVNGVPHDVSIKPPKGPTVWQKITSHFVDCVVDGAKCDAPLRNGLVVQEMMEALLASGRSGKEEVLS